MKHFSKPRIYEFKKNKLKEIIAVIENKPWIVFIFFGILIFILFRSLFGSYFEGDEWFHFTYYLPLTRQPDGFLTALVSTIIDTGSLSGGQHVSPIATVILFLSTKFFGLNFVPYAFVTLLLHTLNSFLVFLLIKILLYTMKQTTKNVFAFMGAIFFAFSPGPVHTITGAAAFYSYNVLSVTFFLLSVVLFKIAFIKGEKKFIYFSFLLLFLSLFTKETTAFIFLLLPFMVLIEKRIFPLKFLGKLFVFCLIVYAIFRFVIPNFNTLPGKIIDRFVEGYIPKSYTQPAEIVDTGTIVSRDISIHKNLPSEILFRTVTFPIKMAGTLFLPRQTVFSIVEFITPIVQPVPPGGDSAEESQARLKFLYGPGNGFILYIASLVILIFCASQIFRFVRRRQIQEAQTLTIGLAIIVLGALPLVAIIFSFPRWGYDFYFDSRHYYNPNVGAAIIFPFLVFGVAGFIRRSLLKKQTLNIIALIIFGLWLINNMQVLDLSLKLFANKYSKDRGELVYQLKQHLPALPDKIVFYAETDGLSAYGPSLPFLTSIPQALTIVYYDINPLPDGFFEKPLFDGEGEGYQYLNGRGFGYYSSKKKLSEALLAREFKVSDIYAFYYKAQDVRVLDITSKVRAEMEDYLEEAKENSGWEFFSDPSGFSFFYPPQVIIAQSPNSIRFESPNFTADLAFISISPSFDINEYLKIRKTGSSDEILSKKVSFDKFHYNDSVVIIGNNQKEYLLKLDDKLFRLNTQNMDINSLLIIEKILGSMELIKDK